MYSQESIIQYLSDKKTIFSEEFGVSKLGFFGSYSRNEQNETSDLDVIFEIDGVSTNLCDIKDSIIKTIKHDLKIKVDLCREKYISKNFREVILSEAIYV